MHLRNAIILCTAFSLMLTPGHNQGSDLWELVSLCMNMTELQVKCLSFLIDILKVFALCQIAKKYSSY